MKKITVKLRPIGNAVGCIIPNEDLKMLGKSQGDSIKIKIEEDEDSFWSRVARFSKEDRKKAMKEENFGQNDLSEWENL